MSYASLTAALIAGIRADGRSLGELADASGVDKGIISRFLRSERTINVRSADRLCEALGVDIRLVKRRTAGKARTGRANRKGGNA